MFFSLSSFSLSEEKIKKYASVLFTVGRLDTKIYYLLFPMTNPGMFPYLILSGIGNCLIIYRVYCFFMFYKKAIGIRVMLVYD